MTFLRSALDSVRSSYTGLSGTYCSVLPDASTQKYLKECCDLASSLGFEATLKEDLHVTLIYSQNTISLLDLHNLWCSGFNNQTLFPATSLGATHWSGHDSTGYVVVKINSPMLRSFNEHLVEDYLLSGNFPDYQPHVTIVTDAYGQESYAEDLVRRLNEIRPTGPLGFTGLSFSDIKE